MKTSYCIYFDEKSYFIVNTADGRFKTLETRSGTKTIQQASEEKIAKSIKQIDQNQFNTIIVYTDNTNKTLDVFVSQFKLIQAGGGFVTNENGEYLFIFRRGKWDLPKGKLDKGETIAECALREVKEETGLKDVSLHDHLCNTYHAYHEKGKFILKQSVWYNMTCKNGQKLTPQTEEDILDIKWLAPNAWQSILDNTFPSIKDVLHASGKMQ